jgi:AMMECR1 domain-containing protein
VLLPQVAVEHAWDRERFLDQTCVKAGLSADAWRQPGVEIRGFTATVFGEA